MLPLIIGDNPFIDDFNDLLQMIPAFKDRGDNIQKLRIPWDIIVCPVKYDVPKRFIVDEFKFRQDVDDHVRINDPSADIDNPFYGRRNQSLLIRRHGNIDIVIIHHIRIVWYEFQMPDPDLIQQVDSIIRALYRIIDEEDTGFFRNGQEFFESALAYRHFHGKHFDIIMNIIVYDLSYSGVSKQDKIRLDI